MRVVSICVVEFLAAGVVPIAHKSGGPLSDVSSVMIRQALRKSNFAAVVGAITVLRLSNVNLSYVPLCRG